MAWREARATSDFATLKPHLAEVLRLAREIVAGALADALPIARLTPWLTIRFAGLTVLWLVLCWALGRGGRWRRPSRSPPTPQARR